MFWGTYPRVAYDDTNGFRERVRKNRRVLVLIGLTAMLLLVDGSRGFRFLLHPTRIPPSAYFLAPIFFWLWVAWWRVRFGVLAWLGRISYSLYLFHLVVATPLLMWMAAQPNESWRGWPVPFYVVTFFALTVIVAAAVYYAVERPSISLGRRFAPGKN
jgi:peptidoglycan/LPS O-acetylase OafA/YrhL